MKKNLKRAFSICTALAVISLQTGVWQKSDLLPAFATQSRCSNYSDDYVLTGSGADDMVNAGMAQKGLTKADLQYSEAWCADFISDLAKLVGQTGAIPFNANAAALRDAVINAGGEKVTEAQAGDLVFYYCDSCGRYVHVGLMVDSVHSIQGNYNGKVTYVENPGQYTDSAGHSCANGKVHYSFVRPNYSGEQHQPDLIVNASRHIEVYDDSFQLLSNHWIDEGDLCKVYDIYGNGFVRVTYSLDSGGENTANARIEDFPELSPAEQGYVMSETDGAGRTIPDGDYWIGSAMYSHFFLDINGVGAAPSETDVIMWTCDDNMPSEYDIWTVTYLGNGFYKIKQRCSDVCLEVANASLSNNANVRVYTDNQTMAQQWSITETDSGYVLKARCNGFNLDSYGAVVENGAEVVTHTAHNDQNQCFTFIPANTDDKPIADGVYEICASGNKAFCLDGSGQPKDYKAGTNVAVWKDAGEMFRFQYAGNGWYLITEYYSGLALDIDNSGYKNFADRCRNVQLCTVNGENNQLWRPIKAKDGSFILYNRISGYCLDLYGNNLTNGANISQHPYNDSAAQHWFITPKTYTLKVDPNGGTYDGSAAAVTKSPQLIFGEGNWWHIGEKGNAARKGYRLDGYYDAKNGGTKIYNADGTCTDSKFFQSKVYDAKSDLTVYAHWAANEYTVSFDTAGGSAVTSQKIKMDAAYGELPKTIKEGFTFDGWFDESGKQIATETKFTAGKNIKLTAHWTKLPETALASSASSIETITTETTAKTVSSPGSSISAALIGDLNNDGQITISDAILLARIAAEDGTVVITDSMLSASDMNGDGFITAEDTTVLLKLIVGTK